MVWMHTWHLRSSERQNYCTMYRKSLLTKNYQILKPTSFAFHMCSYVCTHCKNLCTEKSQAFPAYLQSLIADSNKERKGRCDHTNVHQCHVYLHVYMQTVDEGGRGQNDVGIFSCDFCMSKSPTFTKHAENIPHTCALLLSLVCTLTVQWCWLWVTARCWQSNSGGSTSVGRDTGEG